MANRDGDRFKADPIRCHALARDDSGVVIFQGRETTYRQLDRRCNQVANGLVAAGVRAGL